MNQDVASNILESFGCQVDVVADGQAALEALTQRTYNLVLMDCQMPRLDGLAATRSIRAQEQPGAARLPIIALTAHALASDHEAGLQAGMDDYLSKPLTVQQLYTVLSRWLSPPQETSAAPVPAAVPAAPMLPPAGLLSDQASPLDRQALAQIRALQKPGRPDLLRWIVQMYLSNAPQLLVTMHNAVAQGDARALQQAAHSLKSSSGNIGAQQVASFCQQLETLDQRRDLTQAAALLVACEAAYTLVRPLLAAEIQQTTGQERG